MSLAQTFQERLAIAIKNDPGPFTKIAAAAGYDRNYVRRVAVGIKGNPTIAFVETLAATLACDPAWLLGMEQKG